jgi:hypothetical protein
MKMIFIDPTPGTTTRAAMAAGALTFLRSGDLRAFGQQPPHRAQRST